MPLASTYPVGKGGGDVHSQGGKEATLAVFLDVEGALDNARRDIIQCALMGTLRQWSPGSPPTGELGLLWGQFEENGVPGRLLARKLSLDPPLEPHNEWPTRASHIRRLLRAGER